MNNKNAWCRSLTVPTCFALALMILLPTSRFAHAAESAKFKSLLNGRDLSGSVNIDGESQTWLKAYIALPAEGTEVHLRNIGIRELPSSHPPAEQVAQAADPAPLPAVLQFKMKSLAGKEVDLRQFQNKVLLIVNVASQCGATPQYEQLQMLHETYGKQGLVVMGFPCNQFGQQEPGTAAEIRQFCSSNYGVTFPMFDKVQVNGDDACPLYKHVSSVETKPIGPGEIGWNFEKFLVDRQGKVIGRFDSSTSPDAPDMIRAIKGALSAE